MIRLYNKYVSTLNQKISTCTTTISSLKTAYTSFTNVYNNHILTINNSDNRSISSTRLDELSDLISTSISDTTYRCNKYKIQALMQDDNNVEVYITATRLAKTNKDIIAAKQKLVGLNKQVISLDVFIILCKNVNKEIERSCLEGNVYQTNNIGSIGVTMSDLQNRVDWNKTNELKQLLISKGIKPYDAETKTGVKYLIYHKDTSFPLIKWHKSLYAKRNFIRYTFNPVLKIKTDDRKMSTVESSNPTFESIVNNDKLGIANKLILISKCQPMMLSNYSN